MDKLNMSAEERRTERSLFVHVLAFW